MRTGNRSTDKRNNPAWLRLIEVFACTMRAIAPSTVITKLVTASTSHCATTFIPFDPKLTLGALFKLGSPHEFLKLFIIFSIRIIYSVLRARLAIVVIASAFEAVVHFASWASIVIQFFIPTKCSRAARSRAPRCLCLIFLHINIERKSLELLFQIPINKLVHICHCKLSSASHRAFDLYFFLIHQSFDVVSDALPVKNVPTFEGPHIFIWNFLKANLALDDYVFLLLALEPV